MLNTCPPTDNITTALIAIVGEAPVEEELKQQIPFTGISGQLLDDVCESVRIPRYQIYFTNISKERITPAQADMLSANTEEGAALQFAMIEELSKFTGDLIILLGGTATKLLLGERYKVGKFRGSIYNSNDFDHLKDKIKNKLIGISYHPSSALRTRSPINRVIIQMDFRKFMSIVKNPKILENIPVFKIRPNIDEALSFMEKVLAVDSIIGFDIEATPEYMTCFALSYKENNIVHVMCFPLSSPNKLYWSQQSEHEVLKYLAQVLDKKKILCQNGMFDILYLLRTYKMKTSNFYFDTMHCMHLLMPELPKGLDFLTSIFTHFSYYKDEGKSQHKNVTDWDSYYMYNAKDAAYLHYIYEQQLMVLQKHKIEQYFFDYIMPLHQPLMEMSIVGLSIDTESMQDAKKQKTDRLSALYKELHDIVGSPLNIASYKQMQEYFYIKLGISPYLSKEGTFTLNNVALTRIAKKDKDGAVEAKLIMEMRRIEKMVSTYFEVTLDNNNQCHCDYQISGTVSGRLASTRTFQQEGTNLQNLPYEFKSYIKAPSNRIFIEFDLAKAEAHVVAFLCQDASMIEIFTSKQDIHTYNASKIFNVPLKDVTKEQRQMGKKVVHAANYLMGPKVFSDNLAANGIFMTFAECKELLNEYNNKFYLIKKWQTDVQKEIINNKVLHNLFGRPRSFLNRIDEKALLSGVSYIPQSTVAELLNRGLIKIYNNDELREQYKFQMHATVHDSVLISIPDSLSCEEVGAFINMIKKCLYHEFTVNGRKFSIGVDAKLGYTWGNMKDVDEQNIIEMLQMEK